jgi:DNA-binding CsgD family transcriptional regulator
MKKGKDWAAPFRPWGSGLPDASQPVPRVLQELRRLDVLVDRLPASVVCVIDYRDRSVAYISASVAYFSGSPPSHFYEHGLSASLALFHPEDRTQTIALQARILAMIQELPPAARDRWQLHFKFRWYTNANRGYTWFDYRLRPLVVDGNGQMIYDIGLMLPLQTVPNPPALNWHFSYEQDGAIYDATEVQQALRARPQLSPAEWRVLNLLLEGYTSSAAADKLCLSRHTVDTHRRRILHKTGCKNTPELVRLYSAG